jgi:hypothetical protein
MHYSSQMAIQLQLQAIDDVIIPLTVQDEEVIKQKYPKGYTAPRPYLRMTPQPNK